ncbi:MAG: homoserine dehydrogenase, partial [Proteobacteria bacterium]|nr:homoserine dehydrogenase [Pseudomonadota bacterium]
MKAVKVGLIGLGTVGGGTLNVLVRNAAEISRRAGREIRVTHAAAKEYDPDSLEGLDRVEISDDAFAVVENPDIDIIVELIGGYSPARELVLKAIENGKHVVTANKALIAVHGNEIFKAAQTRGVTVAFEAAVAGGIPIIKALREGLVANHIKWIAGIINGTGNFILSEMKDKGREFADVLKEAQALGYAEADPTFDVEGIDAAHKLTILASLAFGIPLQFEKCYTEGIGKIEPLDIKNAEQFGYRIKHLGITRMTEAGVELRVHPTLIPYKRLIANVDGVMNAVLIQGDAVGPTLYYGAGAGSLPTASAVVADIVDVARALTVDPGNRVPHLAYQPDALSNMPVADMDDVRSGFYMRLAVSDESGVLAKITE